MKTTQQQHPLIWATARRVEDDSPHDEKESKEPIIRLKLDKPPHWEWQLTTTADTLPVIQLLDRDGKLLVETSGGVAQRVRGSFRDGLKFHESFPEPLKDVSPDPLLKPCPGNRNYEGFSSKFGPSLSGFPQRKSRSEAAVPSCSSSHRRKTRKRHSSNASELEKPQIAQAMKKDATTMAKRYSAGDYLRQQILEDLTKRNDIAEPTTLPPMVAEVARTRYKKRKAYLRSQSDGVQASAGNTTTEVRESSSLRYFKGHSVISDEPERTRRVEKEPLTLAGKKLNKEDLDKIRKFLKDKIQAKMQEEKFLQRTSSFPLHFNDKNVDADVNGMTVASNNIRKRYSDCTHADEKQGTWRNYRTRKIRSDANIRFEPEVLEVAKCKLENTQSKILKKSSSGSDRKKFYRKTKSDVLLSHNLNNSVDSEKDEPVSTNYPTRRIKSQDNFERSWREYKERKKQERMQKEMDNLNLAEEDFMKKPRWKDYQKTFCQSRNCKFCENMNYVDPVENTNTETYSNEAPSENDRPGTSLQENYLVIESSEPKKTTIIAEEDHENGNKSPDFGYNSITKRNNKASKEVADSCTNSNVKKSNTFKVIDGADDDKTNENDENNSDKMCYDYRNKTNEEIAKDYFRRVYELLRRRQEEAKKLVDARIDEKCEDTSSSNYLQEQEAQHKKRRRRRKMDKSIQGEDVLLSVVSASPTNTREPWRSLNGSATFCREQQQRQEGSSLAKRPRHPAPPTPSRQSGNSGTSSSGSSANKQNREDQQQQLQRDDAAAPVVQQEEQQLPAAVEPEQDMGANLSRHNGKGLKGRRAQSSGNLCDAKGISVSKILVPCSRSSRESRYKFCGSLPNHLDGKDSLDDDTSENNNVITDTISGNLGGTLPHKKSHVSAHFSDDPSNTLELVKHRSEESLEGDPWKYRLEGADLARCRYAESLRKSRGSDAGTSSSSSCHHHHHHHHEWRRNSSTLSRGGRAHRSAELDIAGTLPKRRQDSTKRSAPSLRELGDGPTRASRISIDKIDDDLLFRRPGSAQHKSDSEVSKPKRPTELQPKPQRPTELQPKPQRPTELQPKKNERQHQPHTHLQGKYVDLKLHKLTTGGEPQDQGYASERSPEDEHPPPLPDQPFPSVTPESTFRVTLTKSSRGLGLSVSGGGTAGPVRVKRLFPQQPAALSNKLQPGDILLAANGIPLTGLTNYEALEVLRTTSSTVELVVCRPPGAEENGTTPPSVAPPPPPTRRDNPGLTLKIPLNPLPPLDVEPCGEFDIEMTKVAGSLGFTLRKTDSSALGHYVRALVREPALSDGRIQPGDKIIAVDGAPLSPLSHEEAVALLRRCGPRVRLRLYRDLAQTPVSALSPTEPDYPDRPTKTCLRQEAVDMLCDLAVRKLSPGTSSGSSCPRQSSSTSCNSPRRLRRPATRSSTADTDEVSSNSSRNNRHSHASTLSQETSDSDQCSIKTQITNSQPETPANDIIDPPPLYDVCDPPSDSTTTSTTVTAASSTRPTTSSAHRPSFLDLRNLPQSQPHHHNHHHHHQQQQQQSSAESQHQPPRLPNFQFSVESDESSDYAGGQPPIVTDSDTTTTTSNLDYRTSSRAGGGAGLSSDEHDSSLPTEPASMPPQLGPSGPTFSYKNPAYQSAHPACCAGLAPPVEPVNGKGKHSSEQDIPGKIMGADEPVGTKGLLKWKGVMFAPSDSDETDGKCKLKEDRTTESAALASLHEQGYEVFMVELTRGWNSRLGFSLQPDGDRTVISVVHPDSVAAKDGRLKQGDILIMVNDESVEEMSTADVIDLLRKIRGSIGITVLRRKKEDAT